MDVLRDYAMSLRFEVSAEYVDRGISGARDRRPALDQLIGDGRCRRLDALAVVKLDRLVRSDVI